MQRFIQTLDLVDDPALINEYVNIHARVWPEILHGIHQVGITRMDIYILGNRLVMLLELPDRIDFDKAMSRLATLPRQAEWEEYVGKFQNCLQKSTSAGKWQRMTKIFSIDPAES
ncbi:MAG: L-rhamnose mutarotase [Muribaculaceae bacterium]|nr:L-rhamnose mutarotase [Muribaculaceae bacterium]